MDKKILVPLCIIFSIVIIITISLIIASKMTNEDSKMDSITNTSSEHNEESITLESDEAETPTERKISEEELKEEIEEIKKKLEMIIKLLVKKELSTDEKKKLKNELGKFVNLNESDIDDENNDYTSDPKIMKSLLDAFNSLLNSLYSINPLREENWKSYSGYYNRNVQPLVEKTAEKLTRVKKAILDKTNYSNTEKKVTKKQLDVSNNSKVAKTSPFGVFKEYMYTVYSTIADFALYSKEILRENLPFSRYKAFKKN